MSQMTYPQHMSSNRVVTIKKLEKVKKKKKEEHAMVWMEAIFGSVYEISIIIFSEKTNNFP